MHSEDSGQTGRTGHFVGFVMLRLNSCKFSKLSVNLQTAPIHRYHTIYWFWRLVCLTWLGTDFVGAPNKHNNKFGDKSTSFQNIYRYVWYVKWLLCQHMWMKTNNGIKWQMSGSRQNAPLLIQRP